MNDDDRYYTALTNSNGLKWITFESHPNEASADDSGFIAVGRSFKELKDAMEAAENLNRMFNI